MLWGSLSGEVEKAAGEHVVTVIDELRSNQTKRWQAICMVKYVLLSSDYPWKIKAHVIEFLLSIFDGTTNGECCDDCLDRSFLIPSIFAALQVVAFVFIIIIITIIIIVRECGS